MSADMLVRRGYFEDDVSQPSGDHSLRGLSKVLYDAVGQLSSGLSEEAISTLCDDAKSLELNPLTLRFRNTGIEAEFQHHVAVRRRPILILVFCFDVTCYLFRMAAKYAKTGVAFHTLVKGMLPQFCNTLFLYSFLWLLNRRSRCKGHAAAQQEEYMLTGIMTLAICSLLATITAINPQDYVYAAMFMISTTCFLKIQWLVGTAFMVLPLILTRYWHSTSNILPTDAETHLVVSWAVGGFMAYLSDTYRRQMFVNHRLARIAASKELQEAQARIDVQQQLAAAQQQAAQRNIAVAREKAANEAKSEFMSLMCHEVRTPLNGCLASAEMLLEMPLQEEQRELAKTIRVSGSILLSTVSNFLDFFKMEAGKQLDVVRTEMNTQELVGDIHCIIEATIGRSADVALDKPNTDGVPKYVLGDPDRLRGILLNLYTNAAKFTKKGSIALRVRIAGRDYRPSPAQVKAQQQRGPNPVRSQGSNRQNGFEAGEQLLQQHRVLFSQDRNTPEGTASPFLSNALAIPHLSHTASAMRSQKSQEVRSLQAQRPSQSRPSQSRHRHRKDFELHNNASQVGQSAAGSEQGSHADRAEFHAQAMLLRGQQAHDCADQAMHVDNSVTTPASCEHIAGQAFLVSTAEKIAEAADTLRGGTCSRQLPGSKAQSQQAPHTQQPDGFLQDHASTPAEAEAVTVNNAIAIGVIKDGDHRFSSNCVLDEQPTSSSSSDDAMQSSGGHSTSREEEGGHSESYNSALSSKHQQQASANGFGEALQMPEALVDTRSCSPCGSGLGERSHSSADMTEHSHRQSSSSFSDCTQPMRRSVSSPGFNSSADDIASEPIKPNRPVTAAGYNGTASDKATLRGGVETSVQDLGNGWHNTVAQRKQPRPSASGRSNDAHPTAPNPNTLEPQSKSPFQAASAGAGELSCDEWLVFEVTDTGCGISKQGLASLFTEYVQGTEDDMKQPRTRGGTGLGLSICSKQVSVLGGLIGAMSKQGEGSTFWFTVPLLKPAEAARESLSMRRTASWGSRDAFTDGHISSHAVPRKVPTGRRTLSATTKAHRSKRCHTTPSQQRSSFSDTDADQTGEFRRVEALNDAAARRRSAPEAPQNRLAQQDPSKLSAVSSDDSTLSAQSHGQPTIQARAAIARAVLGPHPNAPHASDMHLRAEQPRQQDVFSNDERGSVDTCRASAPPPTSEPDHGPDQHVRLSYANIQRNLLMPYGASTHLEQAPADSTSSRSPLMALPEDAPVDYGVSSRGLPGLAGRRSGSPESKPAPQEHGKNIRPSMEARTRRLGSSALQGRSVLLAEDNLINQRVAKMMLCSLGMNVEVACNGQEAVQAVGRNAEAVRRNECRAFDVLLMDMAMPVMGGVDATREIRNLGHAVPIVAMTANASDKDRDECLGAGMDGFLSKPVLKDRLAEAIMSAVSGRRQFQDRGTISLKAYDRL